MYKAVCLHAYREHASLNLIRNLIFQTRSQRNLSKVTRPFPLWVGSGDETRPQGDPGIYYMHIRSKNQVFLQGVPSCSP